MRINSLRSIGAALALLGGSAGLGPAWLRAAPGPSPGPWRYLLLEGSTLLDQCAVCGRPDIFVPMRGTFDLTLVDENPLFSRYLVDNVSFQAGLRPGSEYRVTGKGFYMFGGEVALVQQLTLEARIETSSGPVLAHFTNDSPAVRRRWPIIQVTATQTNGSLVQTFHLNIHAAPVHDIWFSTAHGMTSATLPPADNRVSDGDLLSMTGQRVKRNAELTSSLGPVTAVRDVGLDAVDVLPGGEIVFSTEQNFSTTIFGVLHHGDLLSNRGRVVRPNQELLAAFVLMPPAPDVGLDAVHVLDDGGIWFSIETDVFSERLGRMLRRGDLLSDAGTIVRSNAQLLARFRPGATPGPAPRDYGLDALFPWSSGEIWFSLEQGFQDSELGPIQPGDLLSDQGYVVFRNLELVSAFAPVEDLADFSLDGLFVVTDATAPAPPPRFTRIATSHGTMTVRLEWQGKGRVFQVEGAPIVTGPYAPRSPILPDLFFEDTRALGEHANFFYRLRQW